MIQPHRYAAQLNNTVLDSNAGRTPAPVQTPLQQDAKVGLPKGDGFDGASQSGAGQARLSQGNASAAGGAGGFQWSGGLGLHETEMNWKRGNLVGGFKQLAKGESTRSVDRKWSNTAEDDKKKNSPSSGIPMEMTVFNVGGRREVSAAHADVAGRVAGTDLQASFYAAQLGVNSLANSTVDLRSGTVKANAALGASAHIAGVGISAKRTFGSKTNNTKTSATGRAFVGAEASARGGVTLEPRRGNVGVSAGLDAFAGAKANGMVRQSVRLGGEDVASAAVLGEAWAGVGASASADVGFKDGHLKVGASLGAALGVGGKVGFTVDVDVVGTAKLIGRGAAAVADGVVAVSDAAMDSAVEAGRDLAKAVSSGWDAVTNLW